MHPPAHDDSPAGPCLIRVGPCLRGYPRDTGPNGSPHARGGPGIVLASVFVTLPFVVREVEPVLHELGTEQEQAAATLGSSWWQTFRRITLPSIRWGLTYGIVLTIARTLGEYGAVIMVSSNLPGRSQTLTLLVSDRYNRGAEYGAYALSTLLMVVSVAVLIVQVVLDARRARAAK